ncbi:LysR substrate-binding domain-containing protein [Pantoea sp. LMR881]|uniref:LysR substrate-binding domain-containing protein n=1 Tax=Pantoea sp. LMR881 TaxID=3014336 RepID=UPI0022B04C3C|nr:LysR substrate-binding domain-containing protein [Pantoea sp. LMR881]MCZ4059987.1 LysR substrate-binding domain-containing protein [Pantoea sp. LMR881]
MAYLPKLQQLRVFQAVIRQGSIRSAARALHQSQPAISRALKELEQTLNTTLFIRSAQGVMLTESGKVLASRTQLILEELRRATDEIDVINHSSQGSVAFGLSSLLAFTVLPGAIKSYEKHYPGTRFTIKEAQLSTLLTPLREGILDFAIGSLSSHLPLEALHVEPLFNVPFCVIARRDHACQHVRSFDQLRDQRWIIPETEMGYYPLLSEYMADFYPSLTTPPLRTDSVVCGLRLVLEADFLAVVAQPMARSFGSEVTILNLSAIPEAHYGVIWPKKSPLTLSSQRFLNLLRQRCDKYEWRYAVATTS